jgi:presenilin-like A22 family membrane protease
MVVLGFFSVGMVGVLVGRIYSWVSGCRYEPGLPACNWTAFAGWGGLIGAVTLPALVVGRLVWPRRGATPSNHTNDVR